MEEVQVVQTPLARWIKRNGYTTLSVAERLGVTRVIVWRYASGRTEIPKSFKWRFAEKFGFAEAQLLFPEVEREIA